LGHLLGDLWEQFLCSIDIRFAAGISESELGSASRKKCVGLAARHAKKRVIIRNRLLILPKRAVSNQKRRGEAHNNAVRFGTDAIRLTRLSPERDARRRAGCNVDGNFMATRVRRISRRTQ
jgi:hypothetical protein